MERKHVFQEELYKVRGDFKGADISDLGFSWAYDKFDQLCNSFYAKTGKDLLTFDKDARREARIIILESIKLDQKAKKIVWASEHSFGE